MICDIESSVAAVVGNDETQLLQEYQFLPSDQVLVGCLMKRFNDEPYPDHFQEVNLYSKHPAQLTGIYPPKPYPLTWLLFMHISSSLSLLSMSNVFIHLIRFYNNLDVQSLYTLFQNHSRFTLILNKVYLVTIFFFERYSRLTDDYKYIVMDQRSWDQVQTISGIFSLRGIKKLELQS